MSLFDKNARYTRAASSLEGEVGKALLPVFLEYVRQGYSPREIAHIMIEVALDIQGEILLVGSEGTEFYEEYIHRLEKSRQTNYPPEAYTLE